jgi:hypothetical protein
VDVHVRRSMLRVDCAGLVVLASVVAVDPRGWYPFVVAKFAAVSVAVVVAWWLAMGDRGSVPDRRVAVAFAGLVGVLALAALAGRDPLYAWIGSPERHLGVLTWLLSFAALATGSRLSDPHRLERFSHWVVVSGLALGLYTAVERWHPPIETGAATVRLGGPYGSASFLGAALCLILPVCIATCVVSRSRPWRHGAAVSTALCVAALIGSGTRAALVALTITSVVAAVAVVPRLSGPPWVDPRWGRGVLPLGAVATGVVLASGTDRSVVDRSQGASSRLADWEVGWRIVAEHPWLGVGPEGYRTVLADGVTASYERAYGRSPLPDRAHNVLIDVAAAGGVFAALLFAALAVMVGVAGWRALRSGSGFSAGLAVAAIAYLVQQSFLFPVASIDPIFWLFAGVLVASPATSPVGATWRPPPRLIASVAGPVVLALVVSGTFAVAADRAARQAVDTGNPLAARRAVELRPDVVRYRLLAAELQPDSIIGYDAAIADVERAARVSPHDPIVALALADEMLQKAIATGRPADVDAAVEMWRALAAHDRNCYECHLGAGYASALAGDVVAATGEFGRASALEPAGVTEAHDRADELADFAGESGTDPDG